MAARKIASAPGLTVLRLVIPAKAKIQGAGFRALRFHIINPVGTERFKKASCFVELELRIGGFDDKKKTAPARELETFHVEHRMVRHRQAVQGQDRKKGEQSGDQNRKLKGNRNERWPAVQRPAANVDRIINHRDPVLKVKAADAAEDSPDEYDQRYA